MIIPLPKRMIKVQVITEMIMMKNHNMKDANRRITQLIFLLLKRISQAKVTTENILKKN